MQGGMHPVAQAGMVRGTAPRPAKPAIPQVNLHAFSPPEIWHFHKLNKLPLREVLQAAQGRRLGSLPGGGGEILVDRVRKAITDEQVPDRRMARSPSRLARARRPIDCTMMFGHVETLAERIETSGAAPPTAGRDRRLHRVHLLDDSSRSTPPWPTSPPAGAFEYLRTQAIARLYLDNVPNIQSSWVTQGAKIGQLALFFGANDMGSLMIEENVVASAGTVHYLTLEQIKNAIREAGFTPRQRNVFYEYIDNVFV